ncbi:hypothetical protein ACHQM5_014764 [Ranunculus cassubicifolius]
MEFESRVRRGKALANITNLITTKPSRSASTGSNNPDAINPSSRFQFHNSLDIIGVHWRKPYEVKLKEKRKAVAAESCCGETPRRTKTIIGGEMDKEQRDRTNLNNERSGAHLPRSFKPLLLEGEKSPRSFGSKQHGMSQDFICKQRAYFSEIDAFELPEEEVVSESELE